MKKIALGLLFGIAGLALWTAPGARAAEMPKLLGGTWVCTSGPVTTRTSFSANGRYKTDATFGGRTARIEGAWTLKGDVLTTRPDHDKVQTSQLVPLSKDKVKLVHQQPAQTYLCERKPGEIK